MDEIHLLLVDDHPVVRSGLSGILAGEADFVIVGEADDGAQAVELAARLKPHLVLMDLRMPGMDGVAAITEIRRRGLPCYILVLTTYDTDADILRAIEAGATGYLLKDTPRQELCRSVRAAARGESVLAPGVAARLIHRFRAPAQEALSQREVEVLALVAKGNSNQQTARHLHLSVATVKTHLVHIYAKLGVSDRTSAVTTGLERGIIRLDGDGGNR